MKRPVGLLVLGMHRSGTSALSRLMNIMGANISNDMLPPKADNPMGYWESEEVLVLHERFLRQVNCSWTDWVGFDSSIYSSAPAKEFTRGATEYLKKQFSDSSLFVVKDPRLCLLLPLWKDAFQEADMDLRAVLPIRHPLEVAASLTRRDEISANRATLLWLRYVLDAEFVSRSLPRCFVFYDELICNWPGTVGKIARELHLDWPVSKIDAALEIDNFISAKHRHHHLRFEDSESNIVSGWVSGTYGLLTQCVSNPLGAGNLASLDLIRKEFNIISEVAKQDSAGLIIGRKEIADIKVELADKNDKLVESIAENSVAKTNFANACLVFSNSIEVLQREKKNIERDIVRNDAELSGKVAEYKKLQHEHVQKEAELEAALVQTNDLRSEISRLSASLETLTAVNRELNENSNIMADEGARVTKERDAAQRRIDELVTEIKAVASRLSDARDEANILKRQLDASIEKQRIHLAILSAVSSGPIRRVAAKCSGVQRRLSRRVAERLKISGLPSSGHTGHIRKSIADSGLFDYNWYSSRYPEFTLWSDDPIVHYIQIGATLGYSPGPFFDTKLYWCLYPDVKSSAINPLFHFIKFGGFEDRVCNVAFDCKYYLSNNPDVAAAGINPLVHYIRHGATEGRRAHPSVNLQEYIAGVGLEEGAAAFENLLFDLETKPDGLPGVLSAVDYQKVEKSDLFDTVWYRRTNSALRCTNIDPIYFYFLLGARIGDRPHLMFDSAWYSNKYLPTENKNPLLHFIDVGISAALQPHPMFDTKFYLRRYTEVADAKANPVLHYLRHGWKGYYAPSPLFAADWYLETYPEVRSAKRNPLIDYLENGVASERRPHPDFDQVWYLANNPDVRKAKLDPYFHYCTAGVAEGRRPSSKHARLRALYEGSQEYARGIGDGNAGPTPPVHSSVDWKDHIGFLKSIGERTLSVLDLSAEILDSIKSDAENGGVRISVIMPAWNRRAVIGAAIDSVLNQYYRVHELIIIDDGSDDGTCDFIKKTYGLQISEGLIVLIEAEHRGLCKTRNAGLEVATGDLVAYLDSDNTWYPEFTLFMAAAFGSAPQLMTAYCVVTINNTESPATELLNTAFDRGGLLRKNFIDLNSFVHRKSLYRRHGGFDEQMTRLVDWELILRYTKYNEPAYIPISFVEYYLDRVNLNNVTFSVNWQQNWNHIARKHLRERIGYDVVPLKIGYVIWDWPALSQTFVINELRWLVKNNYDVKVYFKTDPDALGPVDFPITAVQVETSGELIELLKLDERNMLHSPFAYPATTLLTWPAAKEIGVPFTFMPAGVDICHEKNILRNRIDEVSADDHCIGVITLGTFHRKFLIEKGVSEEKLVMERQAVGLPEFIYKQKCTGRSRIISIGRFVEKKGLINLIRAAREIPDADFLIYGFGPLEEELKAETEKLKLANVIFAGRLDTAADLHAAYRSADLFVMPCVQAKNGDMDGLPTVLFEAMAAGVPVVTTRLANIGDLIVDGIHGFLTDDASPLPLAKTIRRALSATPDMHSRIVSRAARRAKDYASTDRMMKTLVSIWRARRIDIVLVTYDTPAYAHSEITIEIIERIYRHTVMSFNLIVVDNGSQDSFLEELENRFGHLENFTLVKMQQNLFVGPGTNIGIDVGTSEYIVYLCSKEAFVLQNGWELHIVREMDANPNAAMGGYLISLSNYRNGSEYSEYSSFPLWRNREFAFQNPGRRFRHLQGGFLIIRRSAYEEVGGFNPLVPHNGTDIEYSFYLESCGYDLLDISEIYSLSNKTWPAPPTLVNERALVIHPLVPADAAKFDVLSEGRAFYCNVCGEADVEPEYRDANAICVHCNSKPFDRAVMRQLSLSGILQGRPNVLIVSESYALADKLSALCKCRVVPIDAVFAEVVADLHKTYDLVLFDHADSDEQLVERWALLLKEFIAAGKIAVFGSVTVAGALAARTLLERVSKGSVTVDEIDTASAVLKLGSQLVGAIGFSRGRELVPMHEYDFPMELRVRQSG